MNYYAPENAHFLLPFSFDPEKLKSDLVKCKRFDFLQNYVPANYNGKNYILPLRSIDGKMNFPAAFPNSQDQYKDTLALESCAYFKEVIDTFKCQKETVRIMNLPPGAVVNTHVDHNCGYEDGIFRIHVPIETNDNVAFTLNDKVLAMKAGEAWYTNVNLPHSVVNAGNTDRVHLVFDCIRNDWSDALFDTLGYNFSKENPVEEKLSAETLKRMIEELELSNSPEAKSFLEQLKSKYGLE